MAAPVKPVLKRRATLVRTPSILYYLADALSDFYLTDEQLESISNRMLEGMSEGLAKATHKEATLKMLPTYVRSKPDGTESGSYLALDLGGTNFRVLLVKLKANERPEMDSQIYRIPKNIMAGDGQNLFDHIAKCIYQFLQRQDLVDSRLSIGFTFSFPLRQEGIDKATLISWTKGFTCRGVVGEDVVRLLREAIDRHGGMNVEISAVVNDTVGTLMSCAYEVDDCEVGLIIGTGTNCCYMENLHNIECLEGDEGDMCINTEWGAFGDDGVLNDIRNRYDIVVDKNSLNPGKQLYEKMMSGMYMGEIVRLVLVKLTEEKVLFDGESSEELLAKGKFDSALVSQIQANAKNGFHEIQSILFDLDLGATRDDCETVQYICEAVSTRSAYLCAAGIAAIARKIKANYPDKNDMSITVGVDGTVYKKHPTFAKKLIEKVADLTEDHGIKVDFMLSFDGSGKGAALIAAVADK